MWTVVSCLVCAGSAAAQTIGSATTVVRDVKGILAGRLVPVSIGDSVYRDQILRTAADSSAVVTFLDKTGMAIGPQSEVRLDDFVFSMQSGPRTVDAVKGLFRFISGPGEAGHDYRVRTPHATIAVRGTTFDIRVTDTQTSVTLHEGAVDVCQGGSCRSLAPGQTIDAGKAGLAQPRALSPSDWTFTTATRREQRAALDAAQSALSRSSRDAHAAFARQAAELAAKARAAAEAAAAAEAKSAELRAAATRVADLASRERKAAETAATVDGAGVSTPANASASNDLAHDRLAAPAPLRDGAGDGFGRESVMAAHAAAKTAEQHRIGAADAGGSALASIFEDTVAALRGAVSRLTGHDAAMDAGTTGGSRGPSGLAEGGRLAPFVLPPSAPMGTVLTAERSGPRKSVRAGHWRDVFDVANPHREMAIVRAPSHLPELAPANPGETPLWALRQRVRDGPPTRPG